MKIGILTLPLHSNYGGNLQAYALMKTLRGMGHEPWLINRRSNTRAFWHLPWDVAKRAVQRYFLGKKGVSLLPDVERNIVELHSRIFIAEHIQPQTKPFDSTAALRRDFINYDFDAVIVGSDQVWRSKYAPNVEDFFLGFIDEASKIRRISYAASFGTDLWQFDTAQTERCRKLINRFFAVSVRESSGAALCLRYFGVNATHVLDPTLLLTQDDYLDLLPEGGKVREKGKGVLTYILDIDRPKEAVVQEVCDRLKLASFSASGKKGDRTAPLSERTAPPVEEWLRGFRDADFIITDSFHASIFAILFKKPFITIGNTSRGLTRLQSLLETFGLEKRLLLHPLEFNADDYLQPMEWGRTDQILDLKKSYSLEYLKMATE
jgi:hypothetical protein